MDSAYTRRFKASSREGASLSSTLIRWGGLAAMVAAAMLVAADLVACFAAFSPASYTVLLLRDRVADFADWLLLVGLIALYAFRWKVLGGPGLIGFLEAFIGMTIAQWNLIWPSVLSSLGWIFLGAASLDAEAYPPGAAILLIAGAGLTGVANAVIQSGLLLSNPLYIAGAMAADIIFNAAIAWLGFSLFTRSSGEVPHPAR